MKRFEEHKQEKRRRPVTFDYFIDHVYVSARALLAVRVLGRHAPPRPQSLESCTNTKSVFQFSNASKKCWIARGCNLDHHEIPFATTIAFTRLNSFYPTDSERGPRQTASRMLPVDLVLTKTEILQFLFFSQFSKKRSGYESRSSVG